MTDQPTSDTLTAEAETVTDSLNTTETNPAYRFSRLLAPLAHPGSIKAESIGALRTHIMAQHMRDGRRSLALCGPAAGVGTTYLATNLAVAMSQAGVKTLLIDANLRDPGVGNFIRPASEAPGLLQCLDDNHADLRDAIRPEVLPGLSVMYAGGIASNAQELLASHEFKSVIDRCMRDFDFTLVDTPPTNICADARRVAAVLHYALIVARRDASYLADVRLLAEELQSDRVKIIGSFLNEF